MAYREVLEEWDHVEASLASQYGLSLRDIFTMKWRRFRLLIKYMSPPPQKNGGTDDVSDQAPSGKTFDVVRDFDNLMGREPATTVRRMTMDEFVKGGSEHG